MTILESIQTYYRVHCGICASWFELSAKNYTKFEAVRILIELKWTVVNGETLCPTCNADWQRELRDG